MAFEFKHPTKYKNTKNNTDKIMPGSGDLSEKEKLISLAMSETAAEEQELSDLMDMKYGLALEKYLENNPGKTEKDFKDMVIRIPLEGGGSAKIIKFSDYKDPAKKVKDIDLASLFAPGKTLASLTKDERDVVNNLLRMTLGNKD
jgi:hypothetical protein|tara:strand:- start:369 stop:803 length:435 start_codon:yes stop_codon:yes gene_type:complete